MSLGEKVSDPFDPPTCTTCTLAPSAGADTPPAPGVCAAFRCSVRLARALLGKVGEEERRPKAL